MFLRQHDLGDWAAVNREGLEKLRSRADCLRVLDDDPDRPGGGPVCNLDPVPAVTWSHDQHTLGHSSLFKRC